jgi:electron-transferring-flavoprotein dehydrogenase
MITGGRGLRNRYRNVAGHTRMQHIGGRHDEPATFDGQLTFDKLADVYHSGTAHDEDQPSHLIILQPDICHPRCTSEFGNPCRHFCPAAVYEMVEGNNGQPRLQINASNCVHCKTCDIMDPYEVIRWVPPEGGGGPSYDLM